MTDTRVVRVAGWEQFRWMRAGFSERSGGVSAIYGGNCLNLGWKEEDDDANVAANRRRFLRALLDGPDGSRIPSLVTMRQVHGGKIESVRDCEGALETELGRAMLECDGLVTDVPGMMLGVQVADCVPVLVADVRRRVVAAFHAGWRGTRARIVERGIARMREEYGSDVRDLVGAVGPSIGACCYTVGDEVRSGFIEEFRYGSDLFRSRGTEVALDLWEANRRQMVDAGLTEAAVTVLGECSACARDRRGERRYFSHRAEMGMAGRMMGVIGVLSVQ